MQNKENKNKLTSEDMELIRNDSTFEQKKKEKKADKWARQAGDGSQRPALCLW